MGKQPLLEVFGYPPGDFSPEACHARANRLCPYNNRVPNCTKDKAKNPLGVCILADDEDLAVICPIRFRERWLIATDAAAFFFPEGTAWTSMAEVHLDDRFGKRAGNIDLVLVSYDNTNGKLIDFGALEVQSVYIHGNVREPFDYYMEDPIHRAEMDWSGQPNYPGPDYLSSSRKRLAPQLLYKGGILNSWGKKQAVVMHTAFYRTLPALPVVPRESADIAWLLYDFVPGLADQRLHLVHRETVYTRFASSLEAIITPSPGPVEDFIAYLQEKLDRKLDDAAEVDGEVVDLTGLFRKP